MEPSRIICITGEPGLSARFAGALEQEGLEATVVADVLEFYKNLARRPFNVAIVDLSVPGRGGYDIVHHLRGNTGTAIVVLTDEDDAMGRIRGYQAGADLCFGQNVDPRELAVVTANLASRIHRHAANGRPGNWRYDSVYWVLQAPTGTSIRLTPKEKTVLDLLVARSGETVARPEILSALDYGANAHGNRNLDTLMRRLRRKVQEEAGQELPVQTVHAVGYIFTAPIAAA
jgi:DNA-binding response OmpR family regulator